MPFVRNAESAARFRPRPGAPDTFQGRIEPSGRYMLHDSSPKSKEVPRGWEKGIVRFERPLVIPLNTDPEGRIYDENSWKMLLSQKFGGKKGRALSEAVARAGYDGIVTVTLDRNCRPVDTREIVDLTMFLSSPSGTKTKLRRRP